MKQGKGEKCYCRWMLPFFGLHQSYRKHLHSHIFDLIYHGNGGFNFTDVYNMPIWVRTFYIGKIIEFKQEEKKMNDKEMRKAKSKSRR
jgi:TM2 domain-containing membrane protein YozV